MTTKKFTPTITRGPRLTPGEISLTPPDDLGIDIPPSGVQKILPYVMGGAMLGMIAIMVAGGTRQLSPYMLMMPLMMIVMMVGGLAGSTGGGGKKVPEINADRKEYLRYLAGLRTRVTSSATSQVAFFSYHAPHPEDLLSIVGTQRQWSRPANADFYGCCRRPRKPQQRVAAAWGGSGSEAYQGVQQKWDATATELNNALQNLARTISEAGQAMASTEGNVTGMFA